MTMESVVVRCLNCRFRRARVMLENGNFTEKNGVQVVRHLIKHPDHTIKMSSPYDVALYKLRVSDNALIREE